MLVRLRCSILLLAFSFATGASAAPPEGIFYNTGFETSDSLAFVPGDLQGQNGWTLTEGTAAVQNATRARGAQAIQSTQATLKLDLSTQAVVLWTDAFLLDAGSTNQPILPPQPATSVVLFHATLGILALDGDRQGHGNFIQVAANWPKNEFIRISLRTDYVNKTYDVWINGAPVRRGLRFKDNIGFTGVERRSTFTSYLDDFSVTSWGLDADSDGDGLIDLDEVKFYRSNPLMIDTDGDGVSDGQEVLAGTLPNEAASRFVLGIEQAGSEHYQIRVPTVSGRRYTLQRRLNLQEGVWENVAEATALVGDGNAQLIIRPNDGTNYFYRALATP